MPRSKHDRLGNTNKTYNKLKEMVISWELPPGKYLNVGQLAEQLNVSVTPVREALMRLCGEGLVECIASRGFFVKSLDVHKIAGIYEVGFMLLKQSVTCVKADQARQLFGKSEFREREWERCETTIFNSAVLTTFYIEKIYALISSLSSNVELERLVREFNSRTRVFRILELQEHARREANQLEIRNIVHALAEGATDRAGDALHAHISRMRVHLPTIAQDVFSRAHRIDLATACEEVVLIGRKRARPERVSAGNPGDPAWCATGTADICVGPPADD